MLYYLPGSAALLAAAGVPEYQSISPDLRMCPPWSDFSPEQSGKAFTFGRLMRPLTLNLQTPNQLQSRNLRKLVVSNYSFGSSLRNDPRMRAALCGNGSPRPTRPACGPPYVGTAALGRPSSEARELFRHDGQPGRRSGPYLQHAAKRGFVTGYAFRHTAKSALSTAPLGAAKSGSGLFRCTGRRNSLQPMPLRSQFPLPQ